MSEDDPELSVVLVAPEGGAGVSRILRHIRAQDARHRIEVVLAVPDPGAFDLDPDLAGNLDLRMVQADLSTSARARVSAIQAARAPIVALVEDHSFPVGEDWADIILADFGAGHAAVGPSMGNANPETGTSWALLAIEYCAFLHADGAPREVPFLPGHNSAYERAALLEYGERLADMLEAEYVMQADLRRRGRTLLLDPRLKVEHLNYSMPARAIRLSFLAGWMFAASRRADWPAWRRAAYAAAAPLIAVRRLPSCLWALSAAPGGGGTVLRALPMLVCILSASAIGEGIGYATGDGGRRSTLAGMEYRRWRNLLPGERDLAR